MQSQVGADDSRIANNVIEGNDFLGMGILDYCRVVQGGPFDCAVDPDVSPGFLADNLASDNRVVGNLLAGNVFTTLFSTLGVLPPCP